MLIFRNYVSYLVVGMQGVYCEVETRIMLLLNRKLCFRGVNSSLHLNNGLWKSRDNCHHSLITRWIIYWIFYNESQNPVTFVMISLFLGV